MSKDIRVIFKGDASDAVAATKTIEKAGADAAKNLERDFQTLGAKTTAAFEAKRQAATSAYDRIKTSGLASTEELSRIEKAHAARMVQVDEEQFGKRTGLLEKFKANWLGATAAIAASWMAAQQAWNLAGLGAKGMQQNQSFSNLAGSKGMDSTAIIADLRRVSGETVATQALVEKAGTAMLLGIEGKMLPKLMEISRAASRITDQTITESFESLSIGVARQSKLLLDNLGILVDVEKANKAYATANKLNALALTEAEKKQAFLNATLAAGQEIIDAVGVSGMTAMEKMQRVGATMENLKEIAGRGVLAVFSALQGSFQGTAAASLLLASGLASVVAVGAKMTGASETAAEFKMLASVYYEAGMDLGQKANDSLSATWDLMSGKLDPVNAKLAEYQQKLTAQKLLDAEAVQEKIKLGEATKSAASALSDYSKSIDDLGRSQLEAAKSGFSKDLERQEEYFKKSGQAAANLSAPIQSYLGVLDQVGAAQKKAHEDIKSLLDKIGAGKVASVQQDINIKTSEKATADARLTAWQSYYDKLQSMHATAMETMKTKQEAALAVKKSGVEFKQGLENKFFPTTSLSEYDQLFTGLARADQAFTAALQQTGPQKATALQSAMDLLKNLPTEVKEGDQVIVSSLEIYEQVISRFNRMQSERQSLADAEAASAKLAADSITTEMQRAQDAMKLVAEEVTALDAKILALNKQIILTMPTDQVNDAAKRIQGMLDAIKDKTITITANYVSNVPSSLSGSSSGSFSGIGQGIESFSSPTPFHAGTSYVPRSGLYPLARGEQILNRNEVGAKNLSPATVTIAPVINISGVTAAGAEKTARELARELEPELRKLASHYR